MDTTNEYFTVNVPVNFPNIDTLLADDTTNNLKADKVRLFLHQMFLSRLRQSGYKNKNVNSPVTRIHEEGYVSLSSNLLKSLLGARYKSIIGFLVKNGLVIKRRSVSSDSSYMPGTIAIQYKFRSDLLHAPDTLRCFRKEKIFDKCTIKAIKRTRNKYRLASPVNERSIPKERIHLELELMEQMVKFNSDTAEEWAKEYLQIHNCDERISNKVTEDIELISAINDGYFISKVDQFGERIHSPLKRVSKRMRPFMYFEDCNDEKLISIDICCSQMYFSTLLFNPLVVDSIIPEFSIINDYTISYSEKEDVKIFTEQCVNGTIYNIWDNIRQLNSRDKAKLELIKIFFSSRYSKTAGLREFKNIYPNVWKCFDYIKSLDEEKLKFITSTYLDKKGRYKEKSLHCNLSCITQRFESRIFLKLICNALLKQNLKPFLTIHDSVFISKKFQKQAENIINQEFYRLGINPPALKISEV